MENLVELFVIGGIVGVIGYLLLLSNIGRDAVIGFTGLAFLGTLIWGIWFFIDEWDTFGNDQLPSSDYKLDWIDILDSGKGATLELVNTSRNKVIDDVRVYFYFTSDCGGAGERPIKIPWDKTINVLKEKVWAGHSTKLFIAKDERSNCMSSRVYGYDY
jgi:hypothetical protein